MLQFRTVEAMPTSPVLLDTPTETKPGVTVKLSWRLPTCAELRGTFVSYQYTVTGIDRKYISVMIGQSVNRSC